jgi:hypothetical protein
LHSTLVANAIARFIPLAPFVTRHPYCHRHRLIALTLFVTCSHRYLIVFFHLYCRLGGEPIDEPSHDDLMVDKAGTKTSYYSSEGTLVASLRPSLQRLTMVGCCDLCKTKAAAPPPAANQRQHHLENVYVSSQLGLI